MATSSSLRSPCERPPARVRAWASSRKSASTSVASCHTGRSAADRPVWQEATDVLALFRLDAHARTLAGGLSQGERKLLDVAIAYALKPKLLFLDEPTSGVGTREKAPIMDTIVSIVRSEGISAAIIEHDMDVVFSYSDRIVAMHQGTILADGTPDQIRRDERVLTTLIGTPEPPR